MAEEKTNAHEQFILEQLQIAFDTNISLRFYAIADSCDGHEDLVYTYLLAAQKLWYQTDKLSPAQKIEVLDWYVHWYREKDMDPPHMEWVRRNRERWS
ncbi:MAG: hypothetical protein HZA34_02130 [Candidatus Pacebacteria bacterium]|nr:hypothetical protein [Candidatus Paceibacterota bacterium]